MYPKFCVNFSQFYPAHSRLVYDPTGTILAILYGEVPHITVTNHIGFSSCEQESIRAFRILFVTHTDSICERKVEEPTTEPKKED